PAMLASHLSRWSAPSALALVAIVWASASVQPEKRIAAPAFRGSQPVQPISDATIIAEAEEFQVAPAKDRWQAKPFGTNYYAATFANCFLSRKAYLGAPEQCDTTTASIDVIVPKAGKYLALVRYESCYRFETQFRLQIEQKGQKKLGRLYG